MRFDAFSSGPYRRFWLGSIASVGSTQLYFIGMAWLVFELSNSALDLGLLGAATAVPTILATLVGGLMDNVLIIKLRKEYLSVAHCGLKNY